MATDQNIQLEIINPSSTRSFRTYNARCLWGFWYRGAGANEHAVNGMDFNQTSIPPRSSLMIVNRAERGRGTGVFGQVEIWTLEGQKISTIHWQNPYALGRRNSVVPEPQAGVPYLIDIGDYPVSGPLGHVQVTIQVLDE